MKSFNTQKEFRKFVSKDENATESQRESIVKCLDYIEDELNQDIFEKSVGLNDKGLQLQVITYSKFGTEYVHNLVIGVRGGITSVSEFREPKQFSPSGDMIYRNKTTESTGFPQALHNFSITNR